MFFALRVIFLALTNMYFSAGADPVPVAHNNFAKVELEGEVDHAMKAPLVSTNENLTELLADSTFVDSEREDLSSLELFSSRRRSSFSYSSPRRRSFSSSYSSPRRRSVSSGDSSPRRRSVSSGYSSTRRRSLLSSGFFSPRRRSPSPVSSASSPRRRSASSGYLSPRRRSISSSTSYTTPRRRSIGTAGAGAAGVAAGAAGGYALGHHNQPYYGHQNQPYYDHGYGNGYGNGYHGGGSGGLGIGGTLILLLVICCAVPIICVYMGCEAVSSCFKSITGGGGQQYGGGGGGSTSVAPLLESGSYQPPPQPPVQTTYNQTSEVSPPIQPLVQTINTNSGPPVDRDVAQRFISALRSEYLSNQDGAVGDFFDSGAVQTEDQGRSLDEEENRVRNSPDREVAIEDLRQRWNM